jgi:2-polyprenyl-3-methyl-5-hydroxy-6-metoxy-1,4-benzoquinol methylase
VREEARRLLCGDGHVYPIINEIPRFVSNNSYASAFGLQWNRYRRTQLDTHTGTSISADRLRRSLGPVLWDALPKLTILECGCGAGRFTEILLARGAKVASVDLSSAVEANRDNCPISERHQIIQADLTGLPFEEEQFDVVLCVGVLQHTPSPETSMAALYRQVRPGGTLVIDHYRRRWSSYLGTVPLVRAVVRRLSPERAAVVVEHLVRRGLPVRRSVDRVPILRSLIGRLIPVVSYGREYPQLTDALQEEWSYLDTYDSLTDWYKHTRSVASIRRALTALGLEDLIVRRGGNGVEASGRKPRVASPGS